MHKCELWSKDRKNTLRRNKDKNLSYTNKMRISNQVPNRERLNDQLVQYKCIGNGTLLTCKDEEEDMVYSLRKRKGFDVYLPKQKIFIEVDGKHHFEKVNFSHNDEDYLEKKLEKTQLHDKMKNDFAKTKGIKTIRLPYWLFNKKEDWKQILDKELQ